MYVSRTIINIWRTVGSIFSACLPNVLARSAEVFRHLPRHQNGMSCWAFLYDSWLHVVTKNSVQAASSYLSVRARELHNSADVIYRIQKRDLNILLFQRTRLKQQLILEFKLYNRYKILSQHPCDSLLSSNRDPHFASNERQIHWCFWTADLSSCVALRS